MGRLLHILLTGAVGAALVHILEIFLMPQVAVEDAWAKLASNMEPGSFVQIDENTDIGASMRALDPNFAVGACTFALSGGPVLLEGPDAPSFWSMSIYNRKGENIYSLNDRLTVNGKLDVLIADPVQIIELQNDMPDELTNTTIAEADTDEGFVVLRAFREGKAMSKQTDAFLSAITCETIDSGQ